MMHMPEKRKDLFKGVFGDLEEFADLISNVLGCPITIEDGSHRLLAYSMHGDATDKARISTIIGRRVPEKVINSLWKEGILPALLREDAPIRVESISEVGLGNRAAVSIRKNNEVLGFIWALEVDKPFSDVDMEFLHLAAKEAKNQLLQHQIRKKKKEESYQEFLWQLLTGHYQTESDLEERLARFTFQMPDFFSILVFRFPLEITDELEQKISYMLTITQKVKVPFFTIDQNRLILLAGERDEQLFRSVVKEFIPYFVMQMKQRFGVEDIYGASGQIYHRLLNGVQSYQEALYVLKIKDIFQAETEKFYLFEELGIYQYLDVLSYYRKPMQTENVAIDKLKAYDAKHQTDLLNTLTVFLHKDSNPNEAAKSLHVHVNTLNYRLKRISEIGNISLKDPLQKIALFLHLKLLTYEAAEAKKKL